MSPKKAVAAVMMSVFILACGLFTRQSGAEAVPFKPESDTMIKTGDHHFTEFTVSGQVTVSLEGDVTITVDGPIRINGEVKGACNRVELRGSETLILEGLISNECADGKFGPEMRLIAAGDITIGAKTSDKPAIQAGGDVLIGDPEGENIDWSNVVGDDSDEESSRPSVARLAAPAFQGTSGTITINQPIQPGAGGSISIPANQQGATIVIAASLNAADGESGTDLNQAGLCDSSADDGQRGGNLRLAAPNGSLTIANGVTLKAGDGGAGAACVAEGSAGDQTAIASDGGHGGSLLVGGRGLVFGAGVTLIRASGGAGGSAWATAADGEEACSSGFNASATAGNGGNRGGMGYVSFDPASVDGTPKVQGGNGGAGGEAIATAGDGMPCDVCPGGEGGRGGNADATGGSGGMGATQSLGFGIVDGHKKGDGGDASAFAGDGALGASCCDPIEFGGNGGQGGDSTASAGEQGTRGLNEGIPGRSDQSLAGDGGDGGDGIPWGAGWAGGVGQGSPQAIENGEVGADGVACAQPVTSIFDDISDGLICQDLSRLDQKIPGFMDVVQVDVEAINATHVQFRVIFNEGIDFGAALAESGDSGWGTGIQFNDPNQPDPPVTNWGPDGFGGWSANSFYNSRNGELESDLAVYQNGQWTRPGIFYTTTITTQGYAATLPMKDIPTGGKGVITVAYLDPFSGQWWCDVAGLGLDGEPSIVVPQYYAPPAQPLPSDTTESPEEVTLDYGGLYVVEVEVGEDRGGHAIPIGAPISTTIEVLQEDSRLFMNFDPPFVPVSGPVLPDGTFVLTGTGVVAGIPGVHVEMVGGFNSIHAAYTMGVNGGLPGGLPITYFLDGDRVEEGPPDDVIPGGQAEVEAFFEVFNASFIAQDADSLFSQLHPVVLERYGARQCRAFLETVVANPLEITNVTVTEFGTWTWDRDDVATAVPDTYTVQALALAQGESIESEIHVAIRPDGSIGWFTDCGDPI